MSAVDHDDELKNPFAGDTKDAELGAESTDAGAEDAASEGDRASADPETPDENDAAPEADGESSDEDGTAEEQDDTAEEDPYAEDPDDDEDDEDEEYCEDYYEEYYGDDTDGDLYDPSAWETNATGMPEMAPPLLVVCFVICIFVSSIASYYFGYQKSARDAQLAQNEAMEDTLDDVPEEHDEIPVETEQPEPTLPPADMMPDMQELYDQNPDIIGWLKVDDMNIDYPVMQTMDDEEYYLNRDFDRHNSQNGCLIMDTDSNVGTGTAANDYKDGTAPSTNLIIHGHNMKNGDMFGNLDRYRDQKYYETHKIIRFSTLYEDREYEIISVFLSQVFLQSQTDVFKYYKFFEADTEAEFDDFYDNIMDMALYNTGVTAKYGDEFITLSVCAYHVENGRLVVVGKRIR